MTEQQIAELKERAGYSGKSKQWQHGFDLACCELQAQVDLKNKDTIRIDWLADVNQSVGNVMLPTVCVYQNLHSLRAAIDMAMQLEQNHD